VSWKEPDAYEYVENLSPSGWAWEFLRRNRDYQADWDADPESESTALKWGLQRMVDPADSEPEGLAFSLPTFGGAFVGERRVATEVPAGRVLYTFDLTLPITPQIKKAHRDLLLFQEMEQEIDSIPRVRKPRSHVSRWTGYLRVLDAYCTSSEYSGYTGSISKRRFMVST